MGSYNEENYGAYIFNDKDNNIDLFLYIKLDQKDLQTALPLSYDKNLKNWDYLAAVFHRGHDYLGQNSLENIRKLIKEKNMQNILEQTYNELLRIIPTLTQNQYDNYFDFSKEQLKLDTE